ncbi:MAG: alkaline phosphatase, partial [Cyanobacteria bacterium J06560_2]
GSKSNSALDGNTFTRETGVAVIREGFELSDLPGLDEDGKFQGAEVVGFDIETNADGETVFVGTDADGNPLVDAEGNPFEVVGSEAPILGIFDPGFDERGVFAVNEEGDLVQVGGFLNAYDPTKGPARPWLPHTEPDYVKNLYPDSANTATTLYTGVKSFNAAIGVDIYEEDLETLGDVARAEGKSFGVVTSVPFNHATPAAALGHVSHRNKLNEEERIVNNEIVLDENGVPLHEDHSGGEHEGEPVFELDENGNPIPVLDDNILYDILNETQPEVVLGGGHYLTRGGTEEEPAERYLTFEAAESMRNGETVYTYVERGPDAAQILADTAASLDVNAGDKLFGAYGARGQGGNLPFTTADGDYSNTGLSSRLAAERPLEEGETVESFITREINENPTLADLSSAALDVLGDDEDGFWVSIEGGDIDWAMHDNNLDNTIGALLEFDKAVGEVQDWIEDNGGYEENLLIITADHDHYFTLNDDFPTQLREFGAEALTTQLDENNQPLLDAEGDKVDEVDTTFAGHYWGSDPTVMNGWAHHTTIPVPVYYQGAGADALTNSIGTGFEQYGFDVPGIEGHVDQVHLAQAMEAALLDIQLIQGTDRADNIVGTDADELIFGGAIRDRIDGGAGDDQIFGEGGRDIITGGDGDDLINGGLLNNLLTGGSGSDTFVL